MAAQRGAANERRSVVPPAAARSLWLSAAWTGAGAALVAAVTAIVVVAICWLPAANGSGSGASAIRAGILTFLAALHGGITVDGLPSAFVPLGMTVLVGVIAWRAGRGLADAAGELGEAARLPLVQAGALQTIAFAAVCGVAAKFSTLGTSHVSVFAATLAGLLLFALTGGVSFVRSSALADEVAEWTPYWVGPALRAACAGLLVYLGAGALLVAGSLVVHRERVEALSGQLGGGWSGVPILLLGALAAPNAAIAGASYLAGPGFAVGSGSAVGLGSTVHGTLPAFPVLGAVPSGPGDRRGVRGAGGGRRAELAASPAHGRRRRRHRGGLGHGARLAGRRRHRQRPAQRVRHLAVAVRAGDRGGAGGGRGCLGRCACAAGLVALPRHRSSGGPGHQVVRRAEGGRRLTGRRRRR
jgi:hypothetical protein